MFERLLPHLPNSGPPVPKGVFPSWPWIQKPGEKNPENPSPVSPAKKSLNPPEEMPALKGEDDFVLVLRKKPVNPVWLKEHQEKLRAASKVAAERTKHLKGQTRVQAMNHIIGEILNRGES